MGISSKGAEYSIAAVSKLTGISCHALRVWERRYGFPLPNRTVSAHRRYGKEQVEVLRHLARMTQSGRSIGELIGEYQGGRLELVPGEPRAKDRPDPAQVVDLLMGGIPIEAEKIIDRAAERMDAIELIERLIEPALIDVGERWFRRECDIFQERFVVGVLFRRLEQMLDLARRHNAGAERKVVVGTVQGDRHEGGVLMVSLALELAGWRTMTLGVDVPIEEYQKAIEAWHPDALGLSFVLSRNINKRFQELAKIRDIPVFVGGRSIVNHQGLARRHGLIPLSGTLAASIAQLVRELEEWGRKHGRPDPP